MNNFEAMYYDEYDYYNILPEAQFSGKSSRKGRTKAEAQARNVKTSKTWSVYAKLERENHNRSRKPQKNLLRRTSSTGSE